MTESNIPPGKIPVVDQVSLPLPAPGQAHFYMTLVLFLLIGCIQMFLPLPTPVFFSQAVLFVWVVGYLLFPHNFAKHLRSMALQVFSLTHLRRSRLGVLTCALFACVTFSAQVASEGTLSLKPIVNVDLSVSERAVVWFVAPLVEELYFRLVIQTILKARCSKSNFGLSALSFPVYLTSLIFALFHLPFDLEIWKNTIQSGSVPFHPGPFFLGLWCGVLMEKERTIVWPVLAHSMANILTPVWNSLGGFG